MERLSKTLCRVAAGVSLQKKDKDERRAQKIPKASLPDAALGGGVARGGRGPGGNEVASKDSDFAGRGHRPISPPDAPETADRAYVP